MISEHSYNVFKVLSFPRKIEYCLKYLSLGDDAAKSSIISSVTVPHGSIQQRIISLIDRSGNNIEVVSTYNDIHVQSNSIKSIRNAIDTLFKFGEILTEIKNPHFTNTRVFKFRKIYRRISDPGEYYPICLN